MISEAAIQFGMQDALQQLGIKEINEGTSTGTKWFSNGKIIESYSPATGDLIGKVKSSTKEDYETAMKSAEEAFKTWRLVPAPKRGEIVRQMGDELRKHKEGAKDSRVYSWCYYLPQISQIFTDYFFVKLCENLCVTLCDFVLQFGILWIGFHYCSALFACSFFFRSKKFSEMR